MGQVLESVSQANLQAALAPVLGSNAVLVSDGGRAYPGCAPVEGTARGGECVGRQACARELSYPNCVQSAPTVESVPRTVSGVATEYLDSYP